MRSDQHHPGLDDDTNSNNAMERSSRDLLSLKNSKYMKQIDNIYEMSHLAKKLDILKMSHHFLDEFACVDTSQSFAGGQAGHGRVVLSTQTSLPTMMPGNSWWMRRKRPGGGEMLNRPMVGREALMMQAFPCNRIDFSDVSDDRLLTDLAGNAFNGMCVGALLDAMFMSIPWAHRPTKKEALTAHALRLMTKTS